MTFHNPQLLWLLLILPILVIIWFWRGMRTVPSSLVLRLLAVGLLILAVANPARALRSVSSGPLIILVDQSDSLTERGKATLRAEADRLAEAFQAGRREQTQRVAVLWFGADVVEPGTMRSDDEEEETTRPLPEAFTEVLDPSASNLAGALQTARELLAPLPGSAEPDKAGHIVLLSDGHQTMGDALAEARLTAEAGLVVDAMPLDLDKNPELRITGVRSPRSLHVGEEYTVDVMVHNSAAQTTQATLRLWEGGSAEPLEETEVELQPGDNVFTSGTLRATSDGVARLRAEITGTNDTFERNNHGSATVVVAPRPYVLLVEGRTDGARDLAAALFSAGVDTETIPATRMPTRLSNLARFDGMVLVDVPAHTLSLDQMASVQEFVRSEGRGLVVTGGSNSFGLGAYTDTPLEKVLPVDMEAPPRPDRSEVALLLIIDRSASMDTASGVSKFDMAKEAAILSTETLRSEDSIGVLAFDTTQEWAVPFQRIGQGIGLEQIQDNIATLPTGGGTDIYNALDLGLSQLQLQSASVRHIVLLTDGRSFTDDRVAYRQLAEAAQAQDITLSTIGIGFDSDTELLDNLARWGGGRYYFADDPEDIPRLTLQESEIARSDPSVEGTFMAELANVHPLLRDFSPAGLPDLQGYVATTPKEEAEIVLASPEGDPVLVSWQYGLGRAVAWTPSVGEPWADNWQDWQDYGRFWAQVVRYTLPEVDSGPVQIRMIPQHGGARLVADAVEEGGGPLDLADAVAQVTLPDGTEQAIYLRQVGPGRYAQDLLLPSDGPYEILVVLEHDSKMYQAEIGYVQNVPAEYVPPPASDEQLQGAALLRHIADMTGGELLDQDVELEASHDDNETESPPQDPLSQAWMWLLGAALISWMLEIAVRRGLFVRDT